VSTFLIALHVIVCLVLILVVLLQRGKGSDMGAALGGGGSNTVFGSRGAGNFLTKLTSACAVVFMLTSLSLAYLGSRDVNSRVFDSDEQANPPSEASLLEEVNPAAAAGDDDASADALEEIPMPVDNPGNGE
jgi:preprotein translocase subunit SecG